MNEGQSNKESNPAEKKTGLMKMANKMKWMPIIMMFMAIAMVTLQINLILGTITLVIGTFLLLFWFSYFFVVRIIDFVDERIQRICEKAFTSAFVFFAVGVGITLIVVVLMEPLQPVIITQIIPLFYPLAYALFIILALFIIFYFYYQRKM